MRPPFVERLHQESHLIGAWCSFASYASTEVMTHLGADFLVLDMQHAEIQQSDFPALLGAFQGSAVTPVVRAPQNDYHTINWLFDQGVDAVLVPMVNSPEDARRAVEAAKFPPVGKRSFGPYRAARYSFKAESYMRDADRRATLIIQIESQSAVEQIDEILSLPGIDAVFVGPNDVAFSMLKPGEALLGPAGSSGGADSWTTFARTPEVLTLCERVLEAARKQDLPFGMTSGSIDEVRAWNAKGAKFMTLGSDFLFMRAGAEKILG
jgi:2-keto-3-deoxy-L-rhamnonate aldolase RhmA